MVIEMLALLLAPMHGGSSVFFLFALNRIISGVAEAAVSGADEALAYDSLKEAGREKEWGDVLEKAAKYTSLAFFFAMMTGSAFYDSSFINHCLSYLDIDYAFAGKDLVKAPVFLTFLSSIVVLIAALGMKESGADPQSRSVTETMKKSFQTTLSGGSWVWRTPSPIRDSSGFYGARQCNSSVSHHCQAILECDRFTACHFWTRRLRDVINGLLRTANCKKFAERRTPYQNFFLLSSILMIGLLGISEALPYWGILPAVLLYATMQSMNYLASRYLNEEAPSEQRATVLSFRGLSTNVSYGAVSLLYSSLIAWIKHKGQTLRSWKNKKTHKMPSS